MIINCSSGGVFNEASQHFTYVYPLVLYAFYSENIYHPEAAYMLNIECASTIEDIDILENERWI